MTKRGPTAVLGRQVFERLIDFGSAGGSARRVSDTMDGVGVARVRKLLERMERQRYVRSVGGRYVALTSAKEELGHGKQLELL